MEDKYNRGKSERYSKSVRAGKRTYFFDVKSTKDDNLYITVTESKRRVKSDGNGFFYEKHKLFLYKEDFIKFTEGLNEAVEYVRKNNPTPVVEQRYSPKNLNENSKESSSAEDTSSYSDVDFEDLDK